MMRVETTAWTRLPGDRAPARTLFAIGDIHGYSDALRMMLGHLKIYIDEQRPSEPIDLVFLGDLIDRGPDPIGVLDLVAKGLQTGHVAEHVLLGNHDWYLAVAAGLWEGRLTEDDRDTWTMFGGEETLLAFGLRADAPRQAFVERLTPAQADVLADMQPMFLSGEILCAHAGVDPTARLEDQLVRDLIWIREPFLSAASASGPWPLGLTVVHGHTPGAEGVFANRIGVDTGGYHTGIFSAAEIATNAVRFHRVIRR